MRVWLALLCFKIAMLVAGSANACMALHAPYAALFDRPPSAVPPNTVILKVASLGLDPNDSGILNRRLIVKIVEPVQVRQYGQVALLQMTYKTSCTRWGRENGEAYAIARVVGQIGDRKLLDAAVYQRSWLDSAFRTFGRETFLATGSPLEWPGAKTSAHPR
jgi:hypothetical protein